MKIGIFTYGTRGDVQPYIALALGLMGRGHEVCLAAPEDFKDFVEGFGVPFHPLYGKAETMMNAPEGQQVLKAENSIKLMQYFFKVLHEIRVPLRQSYLAGIEKVDYVIANSATLPIVSACVEKAHKKMALTYFMPPVVPTRAFPMGDFDFLNIGWYNKLTYKVSHAFYWKFVKEEVNEFRQALGLPILKQNLVDYLSQQKILDLYCLSPLLIPQPEDWESHHKITGFLTIPPEKRQDHTMEQTPPALAAWLAKGTAPIYMGFGSNGVGNTDKIKAVLSEVLEKTQERILFCTGWSVFNDLPQHKNLFVTKYVNHETILPQCKLGVFHGGAGTLATMLRHGLPVLIISFYTDQPTWGKIIQKKQLGVHLPIKALTATRFLSAIQQVQDPKIREEVQNISVSLQAEDGLGQAIQALEAYFFGSTS